MCDIKQRCILIAARIGFVMLSLCCIAACSDDTNGPAQFPNIDGVWDLYMMPEASTDTLHGILDIVQDGAAIKAGISLDEAKGTLIGSIDHDGKIFASYSNSRGGMTLRGSTTLRDDSLAGEFTISSEHGTTYQGMFDAILILK
jgi:hypothetical protein